MDNCRLRRFRPDDFEAFHEIVSDYDVVKMLGSWPYPVDEAFTRMRMQTPEAKAGQVLVIFMARRGGRPWHIPILA